MPGKNTTKTYLEETFYHLYNRGINKEAVFKDQDDYAVFLNLFKRYLGKEPLKDNKGREYPWFRDELELAAFCLLPNHFHILLYQSQADSMARILKSITTTYSMYFNKRYKRVGPVFQSRYKASMITQDAYLLHISRYIHLNPPNYKGWQFSSLPYYLGKRSASWLKPDRIIELFDNQTEYKNFVHDYEQYKRSLDKIKSELANS